MKVYTLNNSHRYIENMRGVQGTDNLFAADVILVDGGDGAVLRAADFLCRANWDKPILGFNTGHVGFLSNDLSIKQLEKILSGDAASLPVQRRSILEVFDGKKSFALNEVVIQPQSPGRLFDVHVSLSYKEANKYVQANLTYKGDGVIVSTASGSTAYNMSAGGPIVAPGLDSIMVTPLNPFSLASRSLILPGCSEITLMPRRQAHMVLDGRVHTADKHIIVNKASRTIKIVKYSNFVDAIQEKLGWNHSIK